MKKIICLLLTLAILTCSAFAYSSNISFENADNQISGELKDKIVYAFKNNSEDMDSVSYNVIRLCDDTKFYELAKIGNNYLITYGCQHTYMDSIDFIDYGDFYVCYQGEGYLVYSADDDKVYNVDIALEKNIINNSDLQAVVSYYNVNKNNKQRLLGRIIGDYNYDGAIDVIDLATMRSKIVEQSNHDTECDMNKDKAIDIQDVVIMRNVIVNGR